MGKKGVYIDRDGIVEKIREVGNELWTDFTADELTGVGNAQRCEMAVEGKKAILDLYFNNDGTTTVTPTGNNQGISSEIKALLEEKYGFSGALSGKSYSIKELPEESIGQVIASLSSLTNVTVEESDKDTAPIHKSYVFTSKYGDKLTVNVYQNGTLTLQGKPAYLYSEAISFLSNCRDVSMDKIVGSVNNFHGINVETSDVREEMQRLMPKAYGKLDETILKMLSPSVILKKANIDLEDYSCYTFPVLRALEGYIKCLFKSKDVEIDENFGEVFKKGSLKHNIVEKIQDEKLQHELERLYDYFRGNRHVTFHAGQILIEEDLIKDKNEADKIIDDVFDLIESSYANIYG